MMYLIVFALGICAGGLIAWYATLPTDRACIGSKVHRWVDRITGGTP